MKTRAATIRIAPADSENEAVKLELQICTLQRSFREYFQVSPVEYIRARRLHVARQALVAGDSSDGSVTRIALDSGFTHLGRFSVDYREHFGESPKETLARS